MDGSDFDTLVKVPAPPGVPRRHLLQAARGGVALVAGGGLALSANRRPVLGDAGNRGTLRGIRVTFTLTGRTGMLEAWEREQVGGGTGQHSRSRPEWRREWEWRQIGPGEATYGTPWPAAAFRFGPPGGEPFILTFHNPVLGRPDVTVGVGAISHPDGPKYIDRYLHDTSLSEGDSVPVLDLFRIARRDDTEHPFRKNFVVTLGT